MIISNGFHQLKSSIFNHSMGHARVIKLHMIENKTWLQQTSLFEIPWLFPNKNKILLTKEMQNIRNNRGFLFHSFIKSDTFQETFAPH